MTTGVRAGASTNEVRLSFVEETVWGTIPASPSFANLRLTGETLQPAKQTVQSEEIRSDRNIAETIMVGQGAQGDISFEMSYGTLDDLIRSVMFSAWTGSPANTMVNGVADTSFTAERRVPLTAGGYNYFRFQGLVANTLALNVAARERIIGTIGFMGQKMTYASDALSGATYAAANQNQIMTAATSIGELSVGGLSPAPRVTALTLNLTNNLREQPEVGNLYNAGVAPGDFGLTGTLTAYFSTGALAQTYLDHDDIGLSFILGDDAGSRYRVTIPTVKLTGDLGINAAGRNQDVMLNLSWEANLDRTSPSINATMQIERGV